MGESRLGAGLRLLAGAAAGYVLLGLLGQNLLFQGTTVSPWWPAAGWALGLGWRHRRRIRSVALGVFLGQWFVFGFGPSLRSLGQGSFDLPSGSSLAYALLPGLGSSLGVLLAVEILNAMACQRRLRRPKDLLAVVLACLGQGLVAAAVGTATLLLTGSVIRVTALPAALTWWQGDVLGGLLLAPMLLMPSATEAAAPASKAESWAAMAFTAAITLTIFMGGLRSGQVHVAATYLCLLPLAWGVLRCPPATVAAQVALVGLVSAAVTVRGMGPFTGFPNLNTQLVSLQLFTAVQALLGQLLALLQYERTRSEVRLVRSREKALEGSRAKSNFLALMSHEIRTPLNGILGAAELLSSSTLDSEQRQLLAAILSSGKGLMVLLNDLLDLSRIEAGQLKVSTTTFHPRTLARDVIELFRPRLAQGTRMEIKTSDELPETLLGDEARIRQILSNLVGNAVKFTDNDGSIMVNLSYSDRDFCMEVSDTGIGIPAELQDTLFQPFTQVDPSLSRNQGGVGLGLALCRRLSEAMGGTIQLSSREGVGSRFVVHLPLEVAEMSDAANARELTGVSTIMPGIRVLVAEDNPVNRLIAERMLHKLDAVVGMAADGEEALRLWEREAWDVILMDCQMPGLDGLEATLEIRRREAARNQSPIPVIALTAGITAMERDACRRSGMNEVLPKPLELAKLRELLGRLGDKPPENQARRKAAPNRRFSP